jgi:hypothetical protein
MPLTVDCTCGKKLQARDELAGKKVKCPQCATVLTLPTSTAIATAPVRFDTPPRPTRDAIRTEPEERILDALPPRPELDDDDTAYDSKLRRRKREAREGSIFTGSTGEILIGTLMIVGGIAWLGLGLAAGIIFYKPAFLIIGGFIAMVKGFVDRK